MKKKYLWTAAFLLSFLIFVFWAVMLINSRTEKKEDSEDERQVVHVMAPYTTELHRQIVDEVAHDYERYHTDVQIEVEYVSRENYKKTICLYQDEGTVPDILICGRAIMPPLIKMGVFREIHLDSTQKNRYRKSVSWESVMSDGKYYGLPFTCDPYMLFYNKNSFEEKQLAVPKKWKELLETGNAVQNRGSYGLGFAAKRPEEAADMFRLMLYSEGGNLNNINREQGIEVFTLLQNMQQQIVLPNTINMTSEDMARNFAAGQVQMMVNKLSSITVLRSQRMTFEAGMTRLPGEFSDMYLLDGDNIGLCKNASEEAEEFLKYLCQPDVYERLIHAMDVLPVFYEVPYRERHTVTYKGEKNLLEDFMSGGNSRFFEVQDAEFALIDELSEGVYDCMKYNPQKPDVIAEHVQDSVKIAILDN